MGRSLLLLAAAGGGPNPQVVQSADAQSTTTSVTATLSKAPTAGNLLLAFVSFQETVAAGGGPVLPSGWTQIGTTLNYNGAVSINYLAAYYMVVPASPATAYTFTATAASGATVGGMEACVIEMSQVYTSSPIDVFTTSGGSSATPSYPSLTTVRDNDTLVGATSFDGRLSSGGITYTTPVNWSTIDSTTGSTTAPIAGGRSSIPALTPGATTAASPTLSASTPWGTFVVAVASVTGARKYLQSIAGTNTTSASYKRLIGFVLSASNTTSASYKRALTFLLSAVNTTSTTLKALTVALLKLSATNTTSAAIKKRYGKFLSAVNTTAGAFRKSLGIILSAVNTTTAKTTTPGRKYTQLVTAVVTTAATIIATLKRATYQTLYIDQLSVGGPIATNILRSTGSAFDLPFIRVRGTTVFVTVRQIATLQPYTGTFLSATLWIGGMAVPLTANPTGYAFTGTVPQQPSGSNTVYVSFLSTTPVLAYYQSEPTAVYFE